MLRNHHHDQTHYSTCPNERTKRNETNPPNRHVRPIACAQFHTYQRTSHTRSLRHAVYTPCIFHNCQVAQRVRDEKTRLWCGQTQVIIIIFVKLFRSTDPPFIPHAFESNGTLKPPHNEIYVNVCCVPRRRKTCQQ